MWHKWSIERSPDRETLFSFTFHSTTFSLSLPLCSSVPTMHTVAKTKLSPAGNLNPSTESIVLLMETINSLTPKRLFCYKWIFWKEIRKCGRSRHLDKETGFRIEKVPKKGQELIQKGPVKLEVKGKSQYMGFTLGEKSLAKPFWHTCLLPEKKAGLVSAQDASL